MELKKADTTLRNQMVIQFWKSGIILKREDNVIFVYKESYS